MCKEFNGGILIGENIMQAELGTSILEALLVANAAMYNLSSILSKEVYNETTATFTSSVLTTLLNCAMTTIDNVQKHTDIPLKIIDRASGSNSGALLVDLMRSTIRLNEHTMLLLENDSNDDEDGSITISEEMLVLQLDSVREHIERLYEQDRIEAANAKLEAQDPDYDECVASEEDK